MWWMVLLHEQWSMMSTNGIHLGCCCKVKLFQKYYCQSCWRLKLGHSTLTPFRTFGCLWPLTAPLHRILCTCGDSIKLSQHFSSHWTLNTPFTSSSFSSSSTFCTMLSQHSFIPSSLSLILSPGNSSETWSTMLIVLSRCVHTPAFKALIGSHTVETELHLLSSWWHHLTVHSIALYLS